MKGKGTVNHYPLPTQPGYYRRAFLSVLFVLPRFTLCTLYVFHSEELGGLYFQFTGRDMSGKSGRPDPLGNSLPIPVSLFENNNSAEWHGPYETRAEASRRVRVRRLYPKKGES